MSGFQWLASYPKSGNTWLRLALWALRHGRPVDFAALGGWIPVGGCRAVFDEVLGVESSDLTEAEVETLRPRLFESLAGEATEPMLRKVHEAWLRTPADEPLFPPAVTLGAVYVVRDPRDVAVALAHHAGMAIDDAVALLAAPAAWLVASARTTGRHLTCRLSTWSLHVESWLDAPGLRVLPVRYEDMTTDMPAVLGDVAAFLGWSGVRPEAVIAAVEATRFGRLRDQEARRGFRDKPPEMPRFFRRGEAGGWRDTLTARQAGRIERDHGRVMERLGYL
ncbi:MAG: sulfotransferase domain-containing protein [Alphaproteobacteria bacterium]|nr:sulfotransferase domain-containing protein [Alphaproteobacteria bacterium]